MSTMFQRLIHASKLQRRSIHTSKTAFSQPLIPIAIGTTLKPLSQTSTHDAPLRFGQCFQPSGLNLNPMPQTSILPSKFILLPSKFISLTFNFLLLTSLKGWGQTTVTFPANGTSQSTSNTQGTWTVPAGVTSILVEVWGGGGGGVGRISSSYAGAGGGGGAYARKTYSVSPGNVLYYQYGGQGAGATSGSNKSASSGGQSYLKITSHSGTAIASANGGAGGTNGTTGGAGGAGATTYSCSGGCDDYWYGGNGGNAGNARGGGGGGGAGSGGSGGGAGTSDGTAGSGGSVWGASLAGGTGGASTGVSSANPGNIRGGGGSGMGYSSTSAGREGGGGFVRITYTVAACSVLTYAGTVTGNQTICSGGDPAAFTSDLPSGGSGGTITYQWQSSTDNVTFTNIASNGTSQNYDPPSGLSTTTYYRRQAKRCTGGMEVTSNVITVTVNTAPSITTHPNTSGNSRCVGGTFPSSLEVAASGTPTPTFQWYSNSTQSNSGGTLISGATNSTHLPQTVTTGNFYYYAIATNSCGTATSNASANRQVVADPTLSAPSNQTICFGGSSSFTSNLSGGTGTQNPDWQYSANGSSGWATVVDGTPTNAVYTNTTTATLNVSGNIAAGTYHYRRVLAANVQGCDAISNSATLTVNALPTITASSGASRCGTGPLGISATASAGSIEWFNASSSGTSQGTSNSAATWTTPSISATTTYYAEAVNGSCRSAARTAVTATVNTAAYRSAATGNWSDATKWEISCDGTNWTVANVAPGSGDGAISIRNGHDMTVAASASLDELTIDAGATLTVNASHTLTIANGTGDDLTVNGSLIINGTISNSGAIKLNSGGLYNHANGTSIPTGITFASGSTIEVSGIATCTNIHSYASRPHHLTWSSTGAMPTGTISFGDELTLCSGDFTLSNGSFLANNNGSGSNYSTVSIGGNLNLSSSGILRVIHNSNGSNSQGVGQINITGNFNMTGGTFDFSNSSNATTGAKLNVSGDFTHTAGSIIATTQPSTAQINLTGTSGTQIIESTGQSCSLTFNVAGSNAQCVVAASKTFVQSANTTFIVAAGTSTPDLLINGTFTRTGTSLTTSGTMSVASGGTYQHNCNGQSLPSSTWDAASTCNITGTSSTTPTNFGQTFGNLTVNCSGTATSDANSTVAGNLTVTGGTLTVGNNFTLGITGNSSITGTLTLGGTGAKTFSGNATINPSGTLTVSGSGAYSLAGNFTNNGTFTPGTAILTLNGGGAQTLDGASALSFSNITINKTGGTLTAAKDMTITGTLTLTSGILDMNGKTLTMGTASANGTITSGSASSYIVALDGGTPSKLIHRVNSTSNATYSFPIGTGSVYTPVTVVMKGGTLSNASIQVWTKNSMVTGMNNNVSCRLNRSWFVEPTGTITNPAYDIQLGFASGDFAGSAGFDLNPVKFSSGIWYKPSGSMLENGTTQGTTSATYYASPSTPTTSSGTVYWNGLTSFSEFGGAGGSAPLPVELVSFNGACEDGIVNLSWQTASEFNSSHFDVEKSRDGESWQVIETIPAAGNSNQLLSYEAFDQVSNILNYYRLNQVDIDGKNKRYDPIAVSCEAMQNGIFMTYPNPSNEGFNILINDKALEGEMNMNIYTATGSKTLQKQIVVKEGINVFMVNEKLLPGLYLIELNDQNNKTKVIKHLVN